MMEGRDMGLGSKDLPFFLSFVFLVFFFLSRYGI